MMMLPFTSFADWVKIAENINSDKYFINFDKIREKNGFKYFWILSDLKNADSDGEISYLTYYQVDCGVFRYKWLKSHHYILPMGKGKISSSSNKPTEWRFPPPGNSNEKILEVACR